MKRSPFFFYVCLLLTFAAAAFCGVCGQWRAFAIVALGTVVNGLLIIDDAVRQAPVVEADEDIEDKEGEE